MFLEVTPERVYGNLSHLNKHKVPGPEGLSNWCSKEYAELLYQPIADILNSSYKEQKLPSVWKHADVTPLPKVKQVVDPKKEVTTDLANRIAFQGHRGLRSIRLQKTSFREDSQFKPVWHCIRLIHCPRSIKYDPRVAPSNRWKQRI